MPRSTRTYRILVCLAGRCAARARCMQGVVNEMNRILDALLPDDGIKQ